MIGVSAFISEVEQEIDEFGVTAGTIAEIAERHGLSDKGAFYHVPGFEHLFFLFGITEDTARAFLELFSNRNDFTATVCSHFEMLLCGGPIPKMPIAKRIYKYKTDHWLPIYFSKKKGENNDEHQ